MSLAEFSVRRPVVVTCVFFMTLALGILARSQLSISLYPDVVFPVMNIVIPYPGASPLEIEEQVAKPVEAELNSLSGLHLVRSLSLDGAVVVTAVFNMNTDLRFAEQKVAQALTRVRPKLPVGILEPDLRSVDPSETPVVTLAFSADQPEAALSAFVEQQIRPRLESLTEVGRIELVGARQREVEVALDFERLRRIQMTASEVVGRLSAAGMDIPLGRVSVGEHDATVRLLGNFNSLDEIKAVPIRTVGGRVISVSDVASVKDGLEDETKRVAFNGAKAVVIQVYRRSGVNAVEAADRVQLELSKIKTDPQLWQNGFRLEVLRDGAKPVREGIGGATDAILMGLFLTVLVVFIFLGNLRSTFITGLALPNSILGAFFLMWMAGFSINITTLAALALAVGLLIDDAIVVRENIYRRMEAGEDPKTASILGAQEVTMAVLATTLTVLAVFGPVSFLHGLIGQFFRQFGLTICFAMLISLVDSLTIAPMLSSYFGHVAAKPSSLNIGVRMMAGINRAQDFCQQKLYAPVLRISLRFPLRTLGVALVVCALSLILLRLIPKAFLPSREAGEFQVIMELPADASLETTDVAAKKAVSLLLRHPEIAKAIATVGGEMNEQNKAQILVLLRPFSERTLDTNQVKDLVRADLKNLQGLRTRIEDLMDIGGGAGHSYTVKVFGDDYAQIRKVAGELEEKLRRSKDLKDVSQTAQGGAKEFQWTIDPDKAEHAGVSSAEAGHELRILLSGATPAHFHQSGHEYDVRVRLDLASRDPLTFFGQLGVPDLNHRLIPLQDVATGKMVDAPVSIARENGKLFIEITAEVNPSGQGLGAALEETSRLFASGEISLPAGVHYEFAGQTKDFQDLLHNVVLAGLLSVLAMYVVLASLYNSFFVPLGIMLVLPLAICGAFYALWLTRSNLDIYSMIGCILLMGVAAKNSILLVDRIHTSVTAGEELRSSVLHACNIRFRPIIMTSFALIAGMLPLALPLGSAASGQAPMAIAVIGGVVSSTLLTLVVVPAAYGYILRLEKWATRS